MPTFQGLVTQEELLQLIEYIKSLAAASAGGAACACPAAKNGKHIWLRQHWKLKKENYLNVKYGVKSWLFTQDHKRIALMYLVAITFFFFLGGSFATVIRLELLTPQGDLVSAHTYNKLFTLHGIIMVFLFLIPAHPRPCWEISWCRS